jgi:hypothetical protein
LEHADAAVAVALHLEPPALEDLAVGGLISRQQLVVDDRLRHVPGRIDVMNFIVSVSSGVSWPALPTTVRVCQTSAPLL